MAARLKQLREDQNTSQEDIAAVAGVSQVTWSTWEREPPKQFAALSRLAKRFGISANYLLGLNDDPVLLSGIVDHDSETLAELHTIAVDMSPQRRREILAIARALAEVEQREQTPLERGIDKVKRGENSPTIIGGE